MSDFENLIDKLDRGLEHTAQPNAEGKIPKVRRARINPKKPYSPSLAANARKSYDTAGSQAALAVHRERTQFGAATQRRCSKCAQPAVRGLDVCRHHGGGPIVTKRRKADGCLLRARPKQAERTVMQLLSRGDLPLDLLRNQTFQAVFQALAHFRALSKEAVLATGKLPRRSAAELQHINALRLLQWEIVRAWLVLAEHGDHQPWANAVGKARNLGVTV